MIHILYSSTEQVDVTCGLARNWKRAFVLSDVYVPDGWVHSIQLNNCMVEFSYVRVCGARIPSGNYIMVKARGSREQALAGDGSFDANTQYFILHIVDVLRPVFVDKQPQDAWKYLEEHAVAAFSEAKKQEWINDKKLRVN